MAPNTPGSPLAAIDGHEIVPPRSDISTWKLVVRTISDVSLAVLIGIGIGVALLVLITVSSPIQHQDRMQFASLPADDEALAAWVRAQPGVEQPAVRRGDDVVELWYRRPGSEPLRPAWAALGYEDGRSLGYGLTLLCFGGAECGEGGSGSDQLAVALLVLGLASGMGFLMVGLWRVRRSRRAGEPLLAFFAGAPRRAIISGAAAGAALLAFSTLSDLTLRALIGPTYSSAGPWSAVRAFAPWAQGVTFALVTLAAPVGEEVFFRGAVFGAFAGAGHARLGAVLSATLFAVGHLYMGGDTASQIGVLLGGLTAGLLFAWVYHRTGSIFAPIVAHGLNNAVSFGLLMAAYG